MTVTNDRGCSPNVATNCALPLHLSTLARHTFGILPLLVLVMLSSLSAAEAAPASFDHTHQLFAQVLTRFIRDGLVDYAALKADPKQLNDYLDELAAVPERRYMKFSEPEKISFLINLYNATTLKLVVDRYPLKSVKDIGTWLNGPFDQKLVRLMGRTFSLGDVEHAILRRNHDEPRVHFALVCGSLGCPGLRNEPYVPDKLNAQLDDQGQCFLRAKDKGNFIDESNRMLYLSKVFKWFEKDFTRKGASLAAYVSTYLPENIAPAVKSGAFKIVYSEYDWGLNDLKSAPRP